MIGPIPLLPDSDADSLNLSQHSEDTIRVAKSTDPQTPLETDPRFMDLDLYAETMERDFTPLVKQCDSETESPDATEPQQKLKLDRDTKRKTRNLLNSVTSDRSAVFSQIRSLAEHTTNENHDADALRRYILQETKTRVTDEEQAELELLLTYFFP